jgi:MFS family permease
MEFTFSSKTKTFSLILMLIGVLSLTINFFTDHSEHHNMFWSNVLFNGFFFFGIAAGALFFMVLSYATEAAWTVLIKRILEGIISFLLPASIILFIVFIAGSLGWHHIYHWMNPNVFIVGHEEYDEVLAGKEAYLNIPFFWIRSFVYVVVFYVFARIYRKRSIKEDSEGGNKLHLKNYGQSGLFLVLFAVFSSTLAWDWIMSIDAHWFSTLFGWYVFSGMWLSAITTTMLIILYLKSKGYLPEVNKNHLHDLGKWMFALSFLWSYLWFSQFMLIWYADIPEEVTYFKNRIDNYNFLFFFTFAINFITPMLILMSRDTKRNRKYLAVMALIILFGHWLDAYLLVNPGVLFNHGHLSWVHVGTLLGFVGLFIYVVFGTLSKAPLVPVNHPYKDESIHHHI